MSFDAIDSDEIETCETCGDEIDDCYCEECERCGNRSEETVSVRTGWRSERTYCQSCADYRADLCVGCDTYHAEDSYVDTCEGCGDGPYCESCRDNGSLMYSDRQDGSYCEDCYSDQYSDFVFGYHAGNPHGIVFHGDAGETYSRAPKGTWFMGAEIEIAADFDAAEELNRFADWTHVHCEEDGSVHDGFETIFQPRTLSSWQAFASEMETAFRESGIRQGDDGHGFHVHVSKEAWKSGNALRRFTDLMTGRDSREAKSLLEYVAGRSANGWCQFEKTNRRAVAKDALKGRYYGLRGAVNLASSNGRTVEIRLGRSNVTATGVLAWLETIAAAVEWSNRVDLTLEAFGALDATALIDWTENRPEYANAHAAMIEWRNGARAY